MIWMFRVICGIEPLAERFDLLSTVYANRKTVTIISFLQDKLMLYQKCATLLNFHSSVAKLKDLKTPLYHIALEVINSSVFV